MLILSVIIETFKSIERLDVTAQALIKTNDFKIMAELTDSFCNIRRILGLMVRRLKQLTRVK